jgi:prolyl 4-hydroxylase
MTNIWQPGDLNKMFERITTESEYEKFEPTVLSRPELLPYDTTENATYQIGPWVVVLENVVSKEEADRLIDLGAVEGYERSSDVGALQFDGTHGHLVNDGRTSTNAWCAEECSEDPVAKSVISRIEYITQIPDNNTEYLQLLRYDVGQHYQTHHDLIEFEVEEQDGVRVLTLYMYLNDVEAGGGTNFPLLNLTVMPKLGRAVMWPSVLNDDPHAIDQRTEHQALPVEKGIKYGKIESDGRTQL